MVNGPVTAEIEVALGEEARRLGFVACGIARADEDPLRAARLDDWLASGAHGQMEWMEGRAHHRRSPQGLWPEAKSVIALGMSYAPAGDPMALAAAPERARISVYAQGADYHKVVKKALKALGRWLAEKNGGELKVFVDTAPLMEKPLAERAGLGWQGKHTNLVSREFGSWLFLGSILTELELPADGPSGGSCGQCRACLDVCPTQAIVAPYRLDARRCISYLTIEHAGPIPLDLRPLLGNRIYGCDDCQLACPWNKFAQTSTLPDFDARAGLSGQQLVHLFAWDEATFLRLTEGGPIRRIGHERWLRNVAVALGNALRAAGADAGALRAALQSRAQHDSALVREHVAWALAQAH